MGREKAEDELYQWPKWFEKNNFILETGTVKRNKPFNLIEMMMNKGHYVRLVKQTKGGKRNVKKDC